VGHIDSPIAPGAVAFRLVSQYADGAPADASSFLPSLGPVFVARFPGQQIRPASFGLIPLVPFLYVLTGGDLS
jgi:hypothetical protein